MAAVEIVYRYLAAPGAGRPMPADGAAAQRRLEAGNQGFAALLAALEDPGGDRRLEIPLDARDVGLLGDCGAPTQRPDAALLGCADARVPTELIFGEGPNDLFVVRVAGNVLGQEVWAACYMPHDLPLRAAVVLGHSGCGAEPRRGGGPVPAAGRAAGAGHRPCAARPARSAGAGGAGRGEAAADGARGRGGGPSRLARRAGRGGGGAQRRLRAFMLQKDLARDGGRVITALHGVYVVNSRLVQAADPVEGERPGLAPAPADEAGFLAAFGAFVRSPRDSRPAGLGPAGLDQGRPDRVRSPSVPRVASQGLQAGTGPPASPSSVPKDRDVSRPHPATDGRRRNCVFLAGH